MRITKYRRALLALFVSIALGTGVAIPTVELLGAPQETQAHIAGSKGGSSRVGRESAQAPAVQLAGSRGGLTRAGRESAQAPAVQLAGSNPKSLGRESS